MTNSRANTERRRGPGRPPEGYVLARIAVCGECGSAIDTVTGRHVRKDGTRPRRYVCRTHRERPEDCAAKPIDAALVDPSVVENVYSILGNVDGIRASVAAARNAERTRLKADPDEAQGEIEKLDTGIERMRRRITDLYAADEQDKAEAVEDALAEARARRGAAEARRDANLDALKVAQEAPEVDEDAFWMRLRDSRAARLSGTCPRSSRRFAGGLKQLDVVRFEEVRVDHVMPPGLGCRSEVIWGRGASHRPEQG